VFWEALGGDPAPGDVDTVRQVAYAFRGVEEDAGAAADRIAGLLNRSGAAVWTGPAADAFRERLARTLPDLRRLAESHGLADRAMLAYADHLDRAQPQARSAAFRATTARQEQDRGDRQLQAARAETGRLTTAAAHAAGLARTSRLQACAPTVALADPAEQVRLQQQAAEDETYRRRKEAAVAEARQRQSAAARAVEQAQAELIAARRLGAQIAELHENAGRDVVRRLGEASAAGIRNRSPLRRWWDDRVEDLREITATPQFHNFVEILSVASDVLAVAAMVAAFVPGLGTAAAGVLLGASAGLAITAAGLTVLARLFGNARTSDAVLAVAAAVPGVRLLAKGGRLLKEGLPLGGKLKRALNYDDARRATGFLRQFTAAPKPTTDGLFKLPVRILGPERYFKLTTALDVANAAKKVLALPGNVETIVKRIDHFDQQPPQDDTWRHRVIDGLEDRIQEKVGR
jgi:hypothetical protein